jgi:hypothetical protein
MTRRLEPGYPTEKGRRQYKSTGSYLSLVLLGRGWRGVTRVVGGRWIEHLILSKLG